MRNTGNLRIPAYRQIVRGEGEGGVKGCRVDELIGNGAMGNLTPKRYVNLKIPEELKVKIKTAAAKANLTIIKFLESLLKQ